MIVKIIVLSLYALMILIIGIISFRKTKSVNDFLLGGGKVGPWMTAFSYGTAYFSAVLFIGFAGQIGWNFGFSGLWVGFFNALIGVLAVWLLLGWKIKKASMDMGVATLSEFLEKRYNSRALKLIASIVIFIFLIPYSAAVFMGLTYLFETSFGIDYGIALIFMGAFTAVYIVLGGYKSMAIIDMIFGIIMTVGVIVLLVSTLHAGGGFGAISSHLSEINPGLTEVIGPPGFWPLFSLVFLTSVAPFAMPQLVQKFYAVKDRRTIKVGAIASTFFAILIGGIAYFVGSTNRVFMSPDNAPGVFSEGKPVFDRLMPELLTSVIHPSLAVVILLLILAASMSTLASLVLISSSSFTKDFWAGFVRRNMSDKSLTLMMRIMSAVFVFLAVLLAYMNIDSIVAILGISWGAIGSFFLGPFIWGLYTKKMNKTGAILSGVIALALCLVLYFAGMPSPQAGTIGMIASLVTTPLFSLFAWKKSDA